MLGAFDTALAGLGHAARLLEAGRPNDAIVRCAAVTETLVYAVIYGGHRTRRSMRTLKATARGEYGIELATLSGWDNTVALWARGHAIVGTGADFDARQAAADLDTARALVDSLAIARVCSVSGMSVSSSLAASSALPTPRTSNI